MNEGRIRSSAGMDIEAKSYDAHFEESQVPHSTALHSVIKQRGAYFVGPLARFNLNRDRLAPAALELANEVNLGTSCRNPFRSIVVRAVEVLHACDEALRLINRYEPPERAALELNPCAGIGFACTETPRGILYHRYELDKKGIVLNAKIVPPTSQNQATIENDLRNFVGGHVDLPDDELRWKCEQSIRNYDPCISCAATSSA